jgi:hypothetical protein
MGFFAMALLYCFEQNSLEAEVPLHPSSFGTSVKYFDF